MIEYFETQLARISHALASIDEKDFNRLVDEAIDALDGGHRIIVTGLGKNVPVCEKFVGTMTSLGIDAFFMNTSSAYHGDMGCLRGGDLLIVLSKSGKTEESIALVRELQRQKRPVRIWLLTFEQASPLADLIPNRLPMELVHEGDSWNMVPNNSTSINLIVLQGLAIHVAQRKNVSLETFARNHPGGAIGSSLKKEAAS